MELLEVVKDIFVTIEDEISDQEAMESVADRSVSSTPVFEAKNKNQFEFL